MTNLTLHAGGAAGADLAWEREGKAQGVVFHKVHHWRPSHLSQLTPSQLTQVEDMVARAAQSLGRPYPFRGDEWVKRNALQALGGEALYAISSIIPPGGTQPGSTANSKGFVNT